MGILSKERYSEQKIENLIEYLKTYQEMGQTVEYEIEVDGFKAVRRTGEPELFRMFEKFVNPETRAIQVTLFQGTSRHNDKHTFTFGDQQKEDREDKSLSGFDVDKLINDRLQEERRDWDYEALQKDYKELEKHAEELEEDVSKLEQEIKELKAGQSPLHGLLGEFGSSLVSGFIKSNPKIMDKIPGLSGLMDAEKTKVIKPIGEEINFSPADQTRDGAKDEAKEALVFINHLRAHFQGENFDKLMAVIDLMAQDNARLETVHKQLTTV